MRPQVFLWFFQETFDKFDNDNSGDMDIVELRDALQELSKLGII